MNTKLKLALLAATAAFLSVPVADAASTKQINSRRKVRARRGNWSSAPRQAHRTGKRTAPRNGKRTVKRTVKRTGERKGHIKSDVGGSGGSGASSD